MKHFGKILSVVGILVVAVVVAAVAVLKSMDFNDYKALIAEQVKKSTGRDLVIKGDLKLEISLSPSVAVDGVTFANAGWGTSPEMITMDQFAAEVSLLPLLSGDVQVNRLVLQGVNVLLETDSKGKANWTFAAEEKPAEEGAQEGSSASLPIVHSIQIRDVKLTYKDGVTGKTQTVSLGVLDLSSDSASSPMNLLLETVYNQEDIKVAGTLGSIAALSDNKMFPVKLEINALGADINIDGTISDPKNAKGLNLGFDVKSDDISDLASRGMRMAGVDGEPSLPAKQFSVSGALRDDDKVWVVDGLVLKIGASDLAGRAAVNLSGKRPDVIAEVSSTLFDLSDVMIEGKDGAGASDNASVSSPDDGRIFPNDPLPLDGLKAVDAEIAFMGTTVNAKGVSLQDVSAELKLKDGRLDVSQFGLAFGGGRIDGNLTLDGSNPAAKLSLVVDGKQIDYGKILKDMSGEETLRGNLDMKIQVRGTGASVRDIMAGLDGTARVQTENGYIDSGALAFATGPLLTLFEGQDAKTLRCAVFDFNIVKGQATSKATVIETGGLSILGEGGVDLAQEKLALHFDPKAKSASFASAAEIGIVVGGTMKAPSIGPDVGDVAKGAASLAAGIATGGLSTIVGMAVDSVSSGIDNTDYCALALSGKPLKPDASSSSNSGGASGSSTATEPAQQQETGGIGGVIQGIFGN